MKVMILKSENVIDENEVVAVIAFNGSEDKILYKGYFGNLPESMLDYNVSISSLSKRRIERFGNALGIFIDDWES